MPTPAIACHRAAGRIASPSADYVWITDDILADAFHHFLRTSSSSQRRYGSNVPGPMEARRRASKRRIACLATSGGGGGVDLSFGALLGLGTSRPPSWRYEPPSNLKLKGPLNPCMSLPVSVSVQ
ncbi:hypothetical protein K432DRAFT_86757 [Lepidopterella palustris CBS 459.81]|uniref:Uncharacterized protein n=1 Tax=Lepidopterella palustris CBS 459.81 TaxID=1314670 RepID=A0A8E2EJF3_9PEZI|nr:hypothetical protein K432DRAFT_86757 [Lepidopterella palustris CBS 459.81]